MVEIHVEYQGDFLCKLRHGPSGTEVTTDPPTDNQGKGRSFSPTDMIAGALGSCMVTTIAMVAQRRGWDVTGIRARVVKQMTNQPVRRIARLQVTIAFPRAFDQEQRELLERAAKACPVHHCLHPEIETPVEFVYPA